MKNPKTKRSVPYDLTDVDVSKYCTVDPQAAYGTKQDDESINDGIKPGNKQTKAVSETCIKKPPS